jgi:hypothetical protein
VEIDTEVAQLEAAEVVYGRWAEETDAGRASSIVEPERVVPGPGAGGRAGGRAG